MKLFTAFAGALLLLSAQLKAQAPQLLNYQGLARDAGGNPLKSQNISLRFTISDNNGVQYEETQPGTTNTLGLFTAAIGSGTSLYGNPFSSIQWTDSAQFLEVDMDPTGGNNYIQMGTMQLLSVPYALQANSASHAAIASTAIYADSTGVAGYAHTATYATTAGNFNAPWLANGNDIYNTNKGAVLIGTTTNRYPGFNLVVSGNANGAVFASDTAINGACGVEGTYYGIGNVDISAFGVIGASGPQNGTGVGGYFVGNSIGAEGAVQGSSGTYYGVYGYGVSDNGVSIGVYAHTEDVANGTTYGVYGDAPSVDHYHPVNYGLYGIGNPVGCYARGGGYGVYYTEMGSTYGILSHTSGAVGELVGSQYYASDYGEGVLGISDDSGSYINYQAGVLGYARGGLTSTFGVSGISQTTGRNQYGFAIYGLCNPYGDTSKVEDAAGYFEGDVDVVGTLTKTSGNFKIDDPLDPANKYLYHSFVESPDMMNIYNGNITTDANGNATVTLPPYFEAENKNFKYQLTCIGQFAQAMVATTIGNNQFTIKTDKPNVQVSWMVTGDRNDPYALAHPNVAEVPKKGIEKGHYLFPQYYGQPKTMSIGYLISQTQTAAAAGAPALFAAQPLKPAPVLKLPIGMKQQN